MAAVDGGSRSVAVVVVLPSVQALVACGSVALAAKSETDSPADSVARVPLWLPRLRQSGDLPPSPIELYISQAQRKSTSTAAPLLVQCIRRLILLPTPRNNGCARCPGPIVQAPGLYARHGSARLSFGSLGGDDAMAPGKGHVACKSCRRVVLSRCRDEWDGSRAPSGRR
jgi:hypothetical protein